MAKEKSPFQSILDKNQYYIEDVRKKSAAWYFKEVDKIQKQRITPAKFLRDNANMQSSLVLPGQLYFYHYDPKTKDTLPYWDKYPMVFPFASRPNGFVGLNMHYLPYNYRIQLFDALWTLRRNSKLDDTTKLKISWAAIQNLSKFPLAKPCVKRYLFTHLRSKPVLIESEHWVTAMMLPIQRFQQATDQRVWMDSLEGIR